MEYEPNSMMNNNIKLRGVNISGFNRLTLKERPLLNDRSVIAENV